jgi:tRNA-splicing ligase RtcB
MKVYADQLEKFVRVPIKAWALPDENTLIQAINLANLPFAFKHIALMPDTHVGYGMPIGGVAALDGVISPAMVGVDIGCGMRVWQTGLVVDEFMPIREKVLKSISRLVPVGFNRHDTPRDIPNMPDIEHLHEQEATARVSVGTLGGGNHFIEVQKDDQGMVWVMIHTGSRNLGKATCDRYNKIARTLNTRWHSIVPDKWELAYLPVDSDEGHEYLTAMNYCLDFAHANREHIMWAVLDAFKEHAPASSHASGVFDIHHNYAAIENHFGRNVWVHRKGAVRAVGQVIIPGSMGSSSYLCKGLENEDSFKSCSHGAGRTMGRKEAIRNIDCADVLDEMAQADIMLLKPKMSDVAEECRQAYKDIDEVMANQADLVTPEIRLTPLGVIKG